MLNGPNLPGPVAPSAEAAAHHGKAAFFLALKTVPFLLLQDLWHLQQKLRDFGSQSIGAPVGVSSVEDFEVIPGRLIWW